MIGVVADSAMMGPHPGHIVGDKYVRAVTDGMDAIPVILPALGSDAPLLPWLSMLDGLLFTGAYSNVEPVHYHKEPEPNDDESLPDRDTQRDQTTLPLISLALDQGVPILGLCRGFQEINVALGGSLHQHVHRQEDYIDHREDKTRPLDIQYGPAHEIRLIPNGYLDEAIGKPSIAVNSLHGQGVDVLASELQTEAIAEDGLVEAFSLRDRTKFLLAVQWHPEWKVTENPDYHKIFTRFATACELAEST